MGGLLGEKQITKLFLEWDLHIGLCDRDVEASFPLKDDFYQRAVKYLVNVSW